MRWVIGLLGILPALACQDQSVATRPITAKRIYTPPPERVIRAVDDAVRFGTEQAPPPASEIPFAYDLPAGWKALPSSSLRLVNLQVAGEPGAECYLTLLPSRTNMLLENVNRWRGQVGFAAVDDAALAAMPRKQLLGADAVYVELEGDLTVQDTEGKRPGHSLVGLVLDVPGRATVTLKMVGPSALVRRELPQFEALRQSLRIKDSVGAQNAENDAGEAEFALRWQVPAGWQETGGTGMRRATFKIAAEPAVDCAVFVMARAAANETDNIRRWYGQMGQTLAEDGVASLPTIQVLGGSWRLVKLQGTFKDAGPAKPDWGMLAVYAEHGQQVVSVKLNGPAAAVAAEEARFIELCQSLVSP